MQEPQGDTVSICGSERSPGEGYGNPLQYSRLENSKNRGAWWATVHEVIKESDRAEQLSNNSNSFLEKESFRTLSLLSQVNVTLSGTYDV